MIELFGLFDDGEIINLKFSNWFLDNIGDDELFEVFEMEYEKRFNRYSPCKYMSGSPNFD